MKSFVLLVLGHFDTYCFGGFFAFLSFCIVGWVGKIRMFICLVGMIRVDQKRIDQCHHQ